MAGYPGNKAKTGGSNLVSDIGIVKSKQTKVPSKDGSTASNSST